MKKLFLFLLCLAMITMGCATKDTITSGNCNNVGGFYVVAEGFQTITDTLGTDERNDITGAIAIVAQGDCAVEFFGCMGVMQDGVVECNAKTYGIDMLFGVWSQETSGRLDFSDETLEASFVFTMDFPEKGYSGTSEISLKSELDVEMTKSSSPLTVRRPDMRPSIPNLK